MERELVGLFSLAVLFLLIGLRIPVAAAMLIVAVAGSYVLSIVAPFLKFGPYLLQFKNNLWSVVANYDLSVVPLFIFMGYLAATSGLSRDLFQGINAIVGRVRGGVAFATILACAGFGAVSGSSLATASTMSKISLPELRKLKYKESLSTGVLAAGGTLGILIPPSIALVIYAIVVEASIIQMFQAAIIPGFLAVLFFIGVIWFAVLRNPDVAPKGEVQSQQDRRAAILRLIPVLLIFGSIILGLGMGLFTPTPAASVGVFAIICYGFALRFITGEGLSIGGLGNSLLSTAKTAGMLYFIIFSADVLKGFFARTGLPSWLSSWAASSGLDPYTILIIMLLALIILGCFMESLSMILVVIPFFWPVLVELNGGDYVTTATAAYGMTSEQLKIWFGILALIVVELGLITPPVGLNVFIIKAFSPNTTMRTIFAGVMPFFFVEILRVGVLLLLPILVLFLPGILSN